MVRDLAILTFITLDGVMQAPAMPEEDRSGDFKHGGWAKPYWDEVMAQVQVEAMTVPYDLLLGRKTYESFASHFTNAEPGQTEGTMNAARKYVATSTLDRLEWNNSAAITGNVPSEVARLKAEDGPLLQVHGSWQLIQTLLSHDLIDEFRLWTFPCILGSGKRLFSDGALLSDLTLVKTRSTANGVVMGIYRRAGR